MKKLAIAVIAAALLWSGYWLAHWYTLRSATEAWFEARRAEGWEASYSDFGVRGFPNRLDATFSDLILADPDSRRVWEAPFFQVLRLVYNPAHLIFAFPDRQVFSGPSNRYVVTSDGLRASVVTGDEDRLERFHLEAAALDIAADEGADTSLGRLRAALEVEDGHDTAYRFGLTAEPEGRDGRRDDLDLRAVLGFDAPISTEELWPDLQEIDLELAELTVGEASLRLTGDLDVGDDGALSGDVDVQAENWRALVDMAEEEGRIGAGVADALDGILSIVAGLRGKSDSLDVSLTIDDGALYLGPLPVGEIPPLPLP